MRTFADTTQPARNKIQTAKSPTMAAVGTLILALLLAVAVALPAAASVALEKDPTEFFWDVQDKAQWGEAEAQFALGMIYLEGEEVEADNEAAAKWIHEAAKQGHVQAMYTYSDMAEKGTGMPVDQEAALHWYKKAAESGMQEIDPNQYYRELSQIKQVEAQQDFEMEMQKERLEHQEKMRKDEQRHREKMYRRYSNNSVHHR